MNKKDFQKTIARIRAEINAQKMFHSSYPKAMLTGQQEAKCTATVNCACYDGEQLARDIMARPDFVALLNRNNATAKIESVKCGSYTQRQIRVDY